jgi:hypothetical protein
MSSKVILVGDNPFHSISHLSQERSRTRYENASMPNKAADLVATSLNNGANGFMFSVSETTLSILKEMRKREENRRLELYPIVPYAYEYVRYATQAGGLIGLGKRLARQLLSSGNMGAVASGLKAIVGINPEALMKTYVTYEISRIKSAAGKDANIKSLLLHEVITDMGLALGLDWLFVEYSEFMKKRDIIPGFNTCNFPSLVNKLKQLNINFANVVIATPFNQVGFQMNPSKKDCEGALTRMNMSVTIAISVLAAGYLGLSDAVEYITTLPNIKGVAIGVSKQDHARQTFRFLAQRLSNCPQ